MASKKDLISKIDGLVQEFGIDPIETKDVTRDELAVILSNLKKDFVKSAKDERGERLHEANKAQADTSEPKKPAYYVIQGKSITTKIGIRANGAEVKAEYFIHGEKTLQDMIKHGHVAKS